MYINVTNTCLDLGISGRSYHKQQNHEIILNYQNKLMSYQPTPVTYIALGIIPTNLSDIIPGECLNFARLP